MFVLDESFSNFAAQSKDIQNTQKYPEMSVWYLPTLQQYLVTQSVLIYFIMSDKWGRRRAKTAVSKF
jgi:hypothetical protein